MSTQVNQVETTQEKQSFIYEAFNLNKAQSRKVIDACIPIMNTWADGSTPNCDVAKACMNAVESADEKAYAVHLFGIFYGINQLDDVDAESYFSNM